VARLNVTLFLSGIERGFERDVIVKTLFFRVKDSARYPQCHKEEIFYHIAPHSATASFGN